MTRDEAHRVTERKQARANRAEQRGVIAAGEIRAAHRSLEQDVANYGQLGGLVKKDHMARGVAGAVYDLQQLFTHRNRVAVFEPAGGGEGLGQGQSEHLGLLGQCVEPELVAEVGPDDGDVQLGSQF